MSRLPTFVVWLHKDGRIDAIGHFVDRATADAYARYCNRAMPASWCEVRRDA